MAVGFGLMGMRRWGALLTATGFLLTAAVAQALQPAPSGCFDDTDCPNQACGGEVCDWTQLDPNAAPDSNKPYMCMPAGLAPKGQDGWCTTNENCKCAGLGAVCRAPYCTFTKPSESPGGPALGGASSVAGSSSAGSPSGAGSSSGGSGSTSTPTPPTSEPMGRDDTTERTAQACSARGAAGGGDFWAALTVFLGITGAFAARRKPRRRIPT